MSTKGRDANGGRGIQIAGIVVSAINGAGLAGLRVEAWDREFFYETPLGAAFTNDDGQFSIDLSTSRRESFLLDNRFDLVFKIYQGESLLHSTVDSVLKNVAGDIAEIVLEVPDDIGTPTEPIVPPEVTPVPGSSDSATAECRVSGTVALANGQPAVRYKVSAADRELLDARQLGEATTDEQGRYDIAYTLSQLEHPEKGAPDLIVSVYDPGGVLLLHSPLQAKAPPMAAVDFRLEQPVAEPSEYERLLADLAPRLHGASVADLTAEQVAYLASVTGQDAGKISLLVAGERHAQELSDTSAGKLPSATYYAWLRQGLPADPASLLRQSRGELETALARAQEENIVGSPATEQLVKFATARASANAAMLTFRETLIEQPQWPALAAELVAHGRIERELAPSEEPGHLSVYDLFAGSTTLAPDAVDQKPLLPEQLRALAELVSRDHKSGRPSPEDLESQGHGFNERQRQLVLRTFALADLTQSHLPLVQELSALASSEAEPPNGSLTYLARLQHSDWQGLVEKTGVPVNIEGEDEATRKANYAATLESSIETAHRTSVIAARIRQERLTVPEKGKSDLNTFFNNNPNFEFGKQFVQVLLAEDGEAKLDGVEDPIALKHNLAALERTVKLTDNHRQQSALLANGLDSAQKMARIGQRDVVARLAANPNVGEDAAKAIYSRASHAAALSTALFMRYRESGMNLPVFQPVGTANPTTNAVTTDALKQIPDLATLFGSLDSCACESCQSVLSPAAYFVDIMKYLEDRTYPFVRTLTLDQEIAFTGTDNSGAQGAYVQLSGSESAFTTASEATEFSFGDFFFSRPSESPESTSMALDIRFVLDGQPQATTRLGVGAGRMATPVPELAAGSHTLSLEVRTVRLGGPPPLPQDKSHLSGTVTLKVFPIGRIIDVVLSRRPDLETIELSCPNSNTPIPYLDLVLEILESEAGTRFPHRIELSGSLLSEVVSDLNSGKVTRSLSDAIKSISLSISTDATVEVLTDDEMWTIRDSSCRLSLRHDSLRPRMFLDSYAPQTPDVAESAGTSPEHFNVTAYEALKSVVYPVGLPYDLWNDDARQNLKFSGTPLHALMTLFYRDTGWEKPELGGPGIRHWRSAVERLGFNSTEVAIIAGTRLGAGEPSDLNYGPWNFWGLTKKDLDSGNSIPDPADSTRRIESGSWPNVLTDRVDVLLQQAGISYDELREVMDMRFVNTVSVNYARELLRRIINVNENIPVILRDPKGEAKYVSLTNSSSSFEVLAPSQNDVTFSFDEFSYSYSSTRMAVALDVRFVLDNRPLKAIRFVTQGDPCRVVMPVPALTTGTHTIRIQVRAERISGDPIEGQTVNVIGKATLEASTLEARLETAFKVTTTCELSKAKLERLGDTALGDFEKFLDRMHRFIRMWRKLEWSMPDIDRALLLANAAIDGSIPFEVHGVVSDPQGLVLAGIRVRAVDQDIAGENTLGNDITDELGRYRIVFPATAYQRTASEVAGPDLILHLNDGQGQSLGQSKRRRNAARSREINLQADVAARVVTDLSAASDNADADFLAAIEWTRNYVTERLGITDQFLDPGRLDTKRYVDFGKAGQPEVLSPYENVYLRRGLTPPPEAFELKVDGNEIRGTGRPCIDYVAHIASACGLSAMDAHRLIADGENTLSLHVLSRLYFSARLARVAGLSIWEFIELRKLCADIIPYARIATLDSVVSDVTMALKEVGMPANEAIWLLSHRTERDVSDTERRQIVTLLTDIRATLAKIYAEIVIPPEPSGPDELLFRQDLQSLGWDEGVIDEVMKVLIKEGTLNTSDEDILSRHLCCFAVIDHTVKLDPTVASTLVIPEHLIERCSYERATSTLHFLGSMTQTDNDELLALSPDADYQEVIKTLRDVRQNQPANVEVFVDEKHLERLIEITTPTERYALLLKPLLSYRRRMSGTSEPLIRQELEYLNWDRGVIDEALGVLSRNGTLIDTDRDIASRHLRYFAVIDHSVTLDDELASTLAIPQSLSGRCFYDRATGRLHFLGSMTQTDRTELIALSADMEYRRAIEILLDVRNNPPDNAELLADDILLTSLVASTTPIERYALLLPVLLSHRRRMYASVAIADRLASTFGFDTRTAQRLLSEWLATAQSGRDSQVKALADFLDPAFVESSSEQPVSPENFPNAYRTCVRLAKVRTLMERLSLSEVSLAWVFAPAARDNAWLDPNNLPADDDETDASLKGLLRLFNLARLRDGIPGGENTLDAIFRLATDAKTPRATLLERMSALTGWNLADLRQMMGPEGFDLNTDTEVRRSLAGEWLLWRLVECFAAIKRLGATAAQCLQWANSEIGPEEAAQISAMARSRHSAADWAEVVKPIRAARRERQRQALVSYLLAKKQMRDSNDLYSHYLIDVEMSPCAMTSRIKQACASIQLFVQRCLLNLEPGVPPSAIDTQLWSWMKNYRVWEANRKVFLYPENWIEPELRDDKSEFFRQLESDLLQSNVTHEAGLEAFKSYIEKLGAISRITVMSMADESQEDRDRITHVTHVLGRDGSAPHRYFYRQWRIPPNSDAGYWTAWEEVNAGIDSNHVLLFILSGSVRIAWPSITPEGTSARMKITMNVVQRRSTGWSAPKRGQGQLWWTPPPNIDETRGLQFQVVYSSTGAAQISCLGAVFSEGLVPRPFNFKILTPLTDSVPYNQRGIINIGTVARYEDKFSREYHWSAPKIALAVFRVGLIEGFVRIPWFDKASPNDWTGGTLDPLPPSDKHILLELLANIVSTNVAGYTAPSDISVSIDTSRAATYQWSGDFVLDVSDISKLNYIDLDPDRDLKYSELGKFEISQEGVLNVQETPFNSPELLPVPFKDAQVFNSNFREKIIGQRGNSDDFLSDQSQLLTKTPGRFLASYQPGGSLLSKEIAAYSDENVDLFFWQPILRRRIKYRMFPCNAWWAGSLGSALGNDNLTQAMQLQYLAEPAEQRLNVGNDVALAQSITTTEIRFDRELPLYVYNWETFFHIPILVGMQLTQNQRFEESQRWFHLVFDPTAGEAGISSTRFWQFKPFQANGQGLSIEAELLALSSGDTRLNDLIAEWQRHPFQPHLIARTRLRAYQIFVVLKYLENLIAWGDQLFRRDTIESINEATQLYILASEILGRRPRRISVPTKRQARTYHELPDLDDFSNALVQVESILPTAGNVPGGGEENVPPLFSLYFCIPQNEKLTSYWDTVEDRLFKIRHCMNIEGIERQLALYEPPIDPALLVRATAAGLDIASVLADLQTPLPRCRFNVMAQRAQDVAGDVKAFGAALLTALEKQDGESLALLRSTQELALLKLVTLVRSNQHEEALANVASLRKTRELISQRYLQYQHLLGNSNVVVPAEDSTVTPEVTPLKAAVTREGAIGDLAGLGLSKSEVDHLGWMNVANNYTITSGSFQTASSVGHFIPQIQSGTPFLSTQFGGGNIGNALGALGSLFAMLSSNASFQGTRAATIGGHQRRFDEWALQSNLAAKELEQIDKQIAAAELRVAIAEQELSNHQKQIDNAQAVDDFMHDKFTNMQLYRWMSGQVASLYFRAYQLAYDLAKRAEKGYRHELGLDDKDSNFIQFGYWDSLKRGLLAGEKLSFDIKRMEAAYLDKNRREFEITKHVSLRRLAPDQLVLLRTTGECTFDIPEWLFDLDGSGHYMRRLKNVSLSIPCVVGPYTGVYCKLTLLKSQVRIKQIASGKYPRNDSGDDIRFLDYPGAIESMVTSSSSNDSGLFETNLRDERYLPFEGSGAVSTWRIELPDQSLAQFDYKTISDVILHLRYTARDGGDILRQAAQKSAKDQLQKAPGFLLILVKDEFPSEWARASVDPNLGSLDLTLTTNMLPYVLSNATQRKSLKLFDATKIEESNRPVGFKTLDEDDTRKALGSPIILGSLNELKKNTGNIEPILLVELM